MKTLTDWLEQNRVCAITGSGGKTTMMFFLAQRMERPCIVTTTTKVSVAQIGRAERCVSLAQFLAEPDCYATHKVTWVSPNLECVNGKIGGFSRTQFSDFLAVAYAAGFSVLVEADGAKEHPLKGWAEHEPVIPVESDAVLCCVGLSALGRMLNDEWVHRVALFEQISGLKIGQPITLKAVFQAMTHVSGGFKGAKANVERIAVLNQADCLKEYKETVGAGFMPTHGQHMSDSLLQKTGVSMDALRTYGLSEVWLTTLQPFLSAQILHRIVLT